MTEKIKMTKEQYKVLDSIINDYISVGTRVCSINLNYKVCDEMLMELIDISEGE